MCDACARHASRFFVNRRVSYAQTTCRNFASRSTGTDNHREPPASASDARLHQGVAVDLFPLSGDFFDACISKSFIIMAENLDDFVAGWVSGIAGLMLTQPVDYVLTRMQSGRALLTQASTAEAAGGLRGLVGMWRGIGPLAATLPINNAMLMYGYGVGKNFSSKDGGASLWPVFLGGCAGGFVQSFLQSPVELLKVRLQLAALGEVPSTSALTLELLRPATATAGLNATLLRDVVPHGVWFAAYEWSKKGLERRERAAKGLSPTASSTASEVPLSTPAQLAAGSFAAFAAWVVGYPADLLKTRCQMIGGPSNISEAARMVYAEGGVGAFYSGLGLKLLRAVPMSAVGFFAYEHTMALLAKRHER